MVKPVKWKKGGDEDQKVIHLIKKGKITKETTPAFLTKNYPEIFEKFSDQVLRNHLSELKRANGIYCKFNYN